jgi:DNA repair ATPase RecN
MLVELVIENYAVIEQLRVRFHPGLNLLTGETGSGKSIVVDALGLLLGGRASAAPEPRSTRVAGRGGSRMRGRRTALGT